MTNYLSWMSNKKIILKLNLKYIKIIIKGASCKDFKSIINSIRKNKIEFTICPHDSSILFVWFGNDDQNVSCFKLAIFFLRRLDIPNLTKQRRM